MEERADHLDAARPLRDEALAPADQALRRERLSRGRRPGWRWPISICSASCRPTSEPPCSKPTTPSKRRVNLYFDQSKYDAAAGRGRGRLRRTQDDSGSRASQNAGQRKPAGQLLLLAQANTPRPSRIIRHVLEMRARRPWGPNIPTRPAPHNNLGRCLQGLTRYEDAVASLPHGLGHSAESPGAIRQPTPARWSTWATPWPCWPASRRRPADWDPARASPGRGRDAAHRALRRGRLSGHRRPHSRWTTSSCSRAFPTISGPCWPRPTKPIRRPPTATPKSRRYIARQPSRGRSGKPAIRSWAPNIAKRCTSENLLANCLYSSDKYADAEPLYQHVAETRLKILGPDHPDTAVQLRSTWPEISIGQRKFPRRWRTIASAWPRGARSWAIRQSTRGKRWSIWPTRWPPWPTEHEQAGRWDAARDGPAGSRGPAHPSVTAPTTAAWPTPGRPWKTSTGVKRLSDADRAKLAEADAGLSDRLQAVQRRVEVRRPRPPTFARRCEGRKAILGAEHRKTLQSENLLANCLYTPKKIRRGRTVLSARADVRQAAAGRRACRHGFEL